MPTSQQGGHWGVVDDEDKDFCHISSLIFDEGRHLVAVEANLVGIWFVPQLAEPEPHAHVFSIYLACRSSPRPSQVYIVPIWYIGFVWDISSPPPRRGMADEWTASSSPRQ